MFAGCVSDVTAYITLENPHEAITRGAMSYNRTHTLNISIEDVWKALAQAGHIPPEMPQEIPDMTRDKSFEGGGHCGMGVRDYLESSWLRMRGHNYNTFHPKLTPDLVIEWTEEIGRD